MQRALVLTLPIMAACTDPTTSNADSGSMPDGAFEFVAAEVYAEVDGVALEADLALPAGGEPHPAIILVHGGGFDGGDRTELAAWALWLAPLDFATISIDYRLVCSATSESEGCIGSLEEGAFPRPLQDAKCAVSWVRANAATYNIDPDRIGALGTSAGAWMSSMLATTGNEPSLDPVDCPTASKASNAINAAVSYYGPTDWQTIGEQRIAGGEWHGALLTNGEKSLLGSDCEEQNDPLCMVASPVTWIDAADAPVLTAHSLDDPAVPAAQSIELDAALAHAGVDHDYIETDGLGHGWSNEFADPTVAEVRDQVILWFERSLKP